MTFSSEQSQVYCAFKGGLLYTHRGVPGDEAMCVCGGGGWVGGCGGRLGRRSCLCYWVGSFPYFFALSICSALQWSLSNLDTLKEVS